MKIKFGLLAILLLLTTGVIVARGSVAASAMTADTHVSATPTPTEAPSAPAQHTTRTTTARTSTAKTQQPANAPSSTPVPTATDTPAPTPTPPTAPSWHTVGSYSGNTEQMLTALHDVQGPVRITWTCQVTDSNPQWALVFLLTDATGSGTGSGAICQSNKTSGVTTLDVTSGGYGANYTLYTHTGSEDVMGNWTASVQAWY